MKSFFLLFIHSGTVAVQKGLEIFKTDASATEVVEFASSKSLDYLGDSMVSCKVGG